MIDTLFAMLSGRHDELPRRRPFADPRLDAGGVLFVAGDEPTHSGWLGRGEVPGPRRVPERRADEAQTVADEMRAIAQFPPR